MAGGCAKHTRLWVLVLVLGRMDVNQICRAAACVLHEKVGDLDVFNEVAGDAAEDGAEARAGVVAVEVCDEYAAQRADLGGLGRPAQPRAEPQEDGATGDVAHGDVADGNIFQQCTIDRLQRDALRALEDAVGDGDVDESAVRLGAALDAPASGRLPLIAAIEKGAKLPAAGDVAVGDGDPLSRPGVPEGEAGLGA